MSGLAARLAAIIGIIGLAGLGLLVIVSDQGARSVTAVGQAEVLARFGMTGSDTAVPGLSSVEVDVQGARLLRGALPPAVLDLIAEDRSIQDRWTEVGGWRFVWTFLEPQSDGEARTALVYASEIPASDPFIRYMMVPLFVAAAVVVWVAVWAGIYLASLIRRARQQSALEASLADATENRRLQDYFLANLSHELRTPLNAIIGFSEVLSTETFGSLGNRRNVEYAENIHRSGLHLVQLVGNMLDHSRIGLGKDQVIDSEFGVEGVVREAVSILSSEAEREDVMIRIDLAPDLPRLNADRMKTMQVVLNLLSNAVKFSFEEGSVTVSARIVNDGALEIAVVDTGIGMSEADIGIVQRPFSRVTSNPHRTRDGTGLGLSLSTSLMTLQGGTLTLESELGKGTRAVATFPASRVRPAQRTS